MQLRRIVIGAALSAIWVLTPAAADEAISSPDRLPASGAMSSAAIDQDLQSLLVGSDLEFDLRQLVPLVCRRNARIIFQELDWEVANERAKAEAALYDPEIFASYNYENLHNPNTATDYYDQAFRDEFRETSNSYQAGVSGLIPTGARWAVDYTLIDRDNDLVRSRYRGDYNTEYQAIFEISLRQPLLRNFGMDATTAKKRLAEMDRDIAFLRYRLRALEVAGTAVSAFWDLYQAQMLRDIRQKSYDSRRMLREIANEKLRFGKVPRSDVLEATAAVAMREAELAAANQAIINETNRMRGLLNLRRVDSDMGLVAVGAAFAQGDHRFSLERSVDRALRHWPEYIIAQKAVVRATLEEDYSRNQALPQLDAMASYGRAGLGLNRGSPHSRLRDGDYPTWTAGVEFRMPLNNDRANANLRAAKVRRRQAMVELDATELAIGNTLDTKIRRAQEARQELALRGVQVEMSQAIVDAETDRYQAGRSRVSDVIEKEETLNDARIAELRAQVAYEKAVAAVELAEGTLLDKYGVQLRLAGDL